MFLPLIIILLELGCYLSMDMFVPGISKMSQDFAVSQTYAQASFTLWFLGVMVTTILFGVWSNSYGRRPIIVYSSFIFIVGSFLCFIAFNMNLFLLGRFLQGLCLSAPIVAGYAAINEKYNDVTAIKIISIMGSITVLAPALGPILGSILIYFGSWRYIFATLTLWGVIVFVLAYKYYPETNEKQVKETLKSNIRHYFNIITNIDFILFSSSAGIAFAGLWLWIYSSPFIIQEQLNFSIKIYGFVQLLTSFMFVLGAFIMRKLLDKLELLNIIYIGTILYVFAALGLYNINYNLIWIVLWIVLLNIGLSFCFSPLLRLALNSSKEKMDFKTASNTIFINLYLILGTLVFSFFEDVNITNLSYSILAIAATLLIFVFLIGQLANSKK